MKKIKKFSTLLKKYEPHLLEECIAYCKYKMKKGIDTQELSSSEKELFVVEDYEELSTAVFHLLHSGYGGFSRNYTFQYKVNRLVEGFQNHHQLVHFANFLLENYIDMGKDREKEFDSFLAEFENFSTLERKRRYFLHKSIMSLLEEDPFPPNRMELLETLKRCKTIEDKIENELSLSFYFEPIYTAMKQIGEAEINEILANFDPEKETPTDEILARTVTRSRA